MSTHHPCDELARARRQFADVFYLPQAPGIPEAGWYVVQDAEDYRIRIWYCPFCGTALKQER